MTREDIIERVLRLDQPQLERLRQFLAQLSARPENQTPEPAPDQEAPESVK